MNSYSNECQICFENIFIKGKLNSCEHSFHLSCIYRWSKVSAICPICRLGFSEISQEINGKSVKKYPIDKNLQPFEEGDQDWAVYCIKCNLPSAGLGVTCKGSVSCPVFIHTYCLDCDFDPNRWLCPGCFRDFLEVSIEEEASSSEEIIEVYQPNFKSAQELINLDASDDVVCVESPRNYVVSGYLIEGEDGEFTSHQLVNFLGPCKRARKEGDQKFIMQEIEKEISANGPGWNRRGAVIKNLVKIIRRNFRGNFCDEKELRKVRKFIRHFLRG